ncbi:hypothetical protein LBMAG52_08950 [Planctomycetia bacterium]|nr:hypothetical protein LBMAG52_08950 [Planctomycetia bacterium]
MLNRNVVSVALLSMLMLVAMQVGEAAEPTAEQREFFETRIRPVLVEQCYECHNSVKKAEGGLAVDQRAALLKGGDEGAIVVPGKPSESRLLAILRHEVDGLKMPKGGAKLSSTVIADFEKWIAMGAPDPRDKAPSADELAKATSWETVIEKRKKWWSFQPIRKLTPPVVSDKSEKWSAHPVDRFVLAKLEEQQLEPNDVADPQTLVRRLFFVLIGLPPSADEVETWTAKIKQPSGYTELVNHLLDSPHFGERWARHWMDWIRYADSHGSEGDPAIDNAWVYRDYLIRALNADVPFDQLVREHVAGDQLERPRINAALGINESMIGPAHWRMVFHGFAPTDALDEKVRFIDDEINAFSKAFLGLTVSCARCHDHKFDPISQKDYYALFGVLGSCRPGRNVIDMPEKLDLHRDKLSQLKPQIRAAVVQDWLGAETKWKASLLDKDGPTAKAEKPNQLLHPWFVLRKETSGGASFADAWQKQVAAWKTDRQQRDEHARRAYWKRWDLTDGSASTISRRALAPGSGASKTPEPDASAFRLMNENGYDSWFRAGTGLPSKPAPAGEFAIATSGENAINGIYPSGVYSHGLSPKHPARLSSGRVKLDAEYDLWLQVIGEGGASTRYVVEDYPRNGTVFPVAGLSNEWKWQRFDLTYWNGDEIHVEVTAGRDAPLMVNNEGRSWFGVREAVIQKKGEAGPPTTSREFLDAIFDEAMKTPPQSFEDLAELTTRAVATAVRAWQAGTASDAQAQLLDACLKQGLLSNSLNDLPTAKPLVAEYRRLEEEIVVPTRVPGLEETVGRDQKLFSRGNHKQPQAAVPRRFLEAIDATPYQTPLSGRRQLAEDLLRNDNPLTRRVIVNRLWHHAFGRGIVATPDNFGRLGSEPTHPELLDYLATRFIEQHGSIKDMLRFLVTSKTWQMSSRPSAKALQVDADNRLLSHAFIRRLEAEAIRDSLLTVSGSLNRDLFGAPTDGNSPRRSVYVRVTRNALDPFLRAFDFPEPFSATGRRDATNVPAQSLTLMNDDRVASLAANWAARVLADERSKTDEARLQSMFVTAFGRPAQAADINRMTAYLTETKSRHAEQVAVVKRLREQMDQQQAAIQKLIEPTRARLLEAAKQKTDAGEQVVPKPVGRWEFESDLQDIAGAAHAEARADARLEGGAVVVKGQGYAVTAPLKQTIKAKTLEAWVQLDNLDQRAGGVMTIQTPDGVVFDSIVFAEQAPRQWMSGSNNFARTQSFNGPPDQDAANRAVHVAIAYHDDGQIVGYRDGQPYGKPYKSNGPIEFKAGQTVISFGVRHLPAGGNRMLAGKILRAQLYDRALTADEIQATSKSVPYFVSEAQVLAALTATEREQVEAARNRLKALEGDIEALGPIPESLNDKAIWTDLAHALFTFQEFVYLK